MKEYKVYSCDPDDEFKIFGGALYQTNDLARAYEKLEFFYRTCPKQAFVIYQPRILASRGVSVINTIMEE